nr:MAG TPA: hypothetical protein [Caudoviricetes sp.]
MQTRGTNPKPTTPRPSNPRIKRLYINPRENIKRVHDTTLKILKIIEEECVTEDEFDIIVKSIRNEFKRLNGNRNRNVEFKIKFKKASFKRFKEVLEKICDSKGVL